MKNNRLTPAALKLMAISDKKLFESNMRKIGLRVVGLRSTDPTDGEVQSESILSLASVITENVNDNVVLSDYQKMAKKLAEDCGYIVEAVGDGGGFGGAAGGAMRAIEAVNIDDDGYSQIIKLDNGKLLYVQGNKMLNPEGQRVDHLRFQFSDDFKARRANRSDMLSVPPIVMRSFGWDGSNDLPVEVLNVLDQIDKPIKASELLDWTYNNLGSDDASEFQREIYDYLSASGKIAEESPPVGPEHGSLAGESKVIERIADLLSENIDDALGNHRS